MQNLIRKVTKQDFEYVFKLYMHPQINPFLLYEVLEKIDFEPIFDELLHNQVLYIFQENNQDVGMFKLMPLKHRNQHIAYLGGIAIHPNFMGNGLGTKMMHSILNFGEQHGFLRIELSTATSNTKAINLYESVGFQREGILRKYTFLKSQNRFLDEVLMAYLYPDNLN